MAIDVVVAEHVEDDEGEDDGMPEQGRARTAVLDIDRRRGRFTGVSGRRRHCTLIKDCCRSRSGFGHRVCGGCDSRKCGK